jgi:HD-GYP domain-containing protein (c-di-GMP phosphodiesterase class II)
MGYPEGLAGEEIPLGARIVQIIDAWDAMTSDRPYRKAMPKAAAIAELRRQEGTQFDPKFVEIFLRVVDRLEREGVPTTEQSVEKPLAARPA